MSRSSDAVLLTPVSSVRHHNSTSAPELEDESSRDEPAVANTALDLRPVTRRRQILVLISAFLTIFITIGFNQAYGVFQSYYTSPTQTMLPKSTSQDSALVAFVGTLGYGLTWGGSIFINPIMARLGVKGNRLLGVIGVIAMSTAFALASISTQVWHLLLTQGLLFGLGASLLYFPILSAAPEYFTAHRGSAMGFILSGAGIGGLVFSPVVRVLISAIGPRWTLRSLCLFNLVISLPIAVTASPSRFLGRRSTHVDLKLALRPAFLFSAGAAFFQAAGNGLPSTFLSEYSIAIGYSAGFGATLLAISNGVNSVSRIVTGYVADKWGRQNTLIATVCLSVASVLGFWLASTTAGGSRVLWLLFVVFYGITGAGYNALFPTTVVEVFGLQAYSSVNGFMYFVRGMGMVFGSPVGGKILGENRVGNYKNMVLFDAALLAGGALCVVGIRCGDAIDKRAWKWKA